MANDPMIPDDSDLVPISSQDSVRSPASIPEGPSDSDLVSPEEYNQQNYGTLPQTLLGGAEQIAQGVIGPVAPALEEASGLTTGEAIRGRAEQLGGAAPLLQGVGLVGSSLTGLGEASLAGQVANIGEHAAAALPEATSLVGRIATTGVKTGAELAALQGSDELSKMVTGDPNQSLQSAAINIGLAGIMGGAGGVALGTITPFFKKAGAVIGVNQLLSDFMGEIPFLKQPLTPVEGMTKDITTRLAQTDALLNSGTKRELIDNLTQDVTPDQLGKHVREVSDILDNAPKALQKEKLYQDAVQGWKSQVTPQIDPLTLQPKFTPQAADVFSATENLKRQMQEWAQYNKALVPVGEQAWRSAAQSVAPALRESLEDSKVWNSAGDFQKQFNKALAPLFDVQKEFRPKFTTQEFGERVADPTKVNTYWNQLNKEAPSKRSDFLRNYLDQTQSVADAVSQAHLNAGLPIPEEAQFDSPSYLNHALNTPASPGVKLARWGMQHGSALLGNSIGEVAAGATGAGLGSLVGHPLLGGYIGEKLLRPTFSSLAKPFAENAIHSEAAKAAVDYIGNVSKGQNLLKESVGNFFKAGARAISPELMPNQASRDKLEKSLELAQNPQNLLNTGGNLGHYLPEHATAAAQVASTASQYLANLKPKQTPGKPLDPLPPISSHAQATYNRALNLAQQPLMVLQYAKDGTLMPQDLQTLSTIYPALRQQIASKLGQEMISAKAEGTKIPYSQRMGLSMIMGLPADSTFTPQSMQAILATSNSIQEQTAPQGKQKKPSAKALTEVSKGANLYATGQQSRELERRK